MPPTPNDGRLSPRTFWLAIGLMLAAHAGVAVDCARRVTVTHDEYWHLPVGLLNWKTGRFDFENLNPLLTRLCGALPLCFVGAKTGDYEAVDVDHGYEEAFLVANRDRYFALFWLGRLPNVAFSVGIGAMLALWARRFRGDAAALLTVLMWSCSATALANASLMTPDIGVTFFFLAVFYQLWNYAGQPTWRRAIFVGVLLGLAQLCKYTAVLLYPMGLVGWLVLSVWRTGQSACEPPRNWKTQLAQGAAMGVISLVVLNAGYLFHGSGSSLKSYQFASQSMQRIQQQAGALSDLPVPLPRDYLEGFDRQRQIMEGRHPVYLNEVWSVSGFVSYFAMALVYKLSHAEQLLALLTICFLLFPDGEKRDLRRQAFLWVPIVGLMIVASTSTMQLGLRYILPVIPFLFLFAGQAAIWLQRTRFPTRSVLVGLAIVGLPTTLRFHPHYLAYFNELAGGPENGRYHLLDSNLDWGQDLRDLKPYLDQQGITDIGLAYYGTLPPSAVGIQFHLPPGRAPVPGWFAVSVNYVQGRPHILRDPEGKPHVAGLDEFAYFRFFEPKAHIGYSINVYHLSEEDVALWRNAVRRQSPFP
ncbi:MAG TPA: glycosyltransferase family 39 protein [Planctomycetaceae bacterium]|nr:glycosyltransferase family 39 protein [Planctomycetaceae bacterium]